LLACCTFHLHCLPRRRPLFPYTTLFRSAAYARQRVVPEDQPFVAPRALNRDRAAEHRLRMRGREVVGDLHVPRRLRIVAELVQRSEEHTSELQSRVDLVCRLLLEKKKIT